MGRERISPEEAGMKVLQEWYCESGFMHRIYSWHEQYFRECMTKSVVAEFPEEWERVKTRADNGNRRMLYYREKRSGPPNYISGMRRCSSEQYCERCGRHPPKPSSKDKFLARK